LALRLRVKAMLDAKLSVGEIFERLKGQFETEQVADALRSLTATVPETSRSWPVEPPTGPAASAAEPESGPEPEAEPEPDTPPEPDPEASEPFIANDVARLFSLLDLVVSGDAPGVVIEFIGSRRGEGTSTIAREFAQVCAVHSDRPVLLLDLDLRHDGQFDHFADRRGKDRELRRPGGATDIGVDLGQLVRVDFEMAGLHASDRLITSHRVGDTALYVSRLHPLLRERKLTPQVTKTPTFWTELRRLTAVTVVDCPPFSDSFDGLAISSLVDRVVVVVEAESTRLPVVAELCDRLSVQNAPVAGVVFNKRRFYIPRFIYRWI
jgi:Mrp family chromosome partitioning ATPase